MTSRTRKVLATAAILAIVAAGCSSSKSGGGGSSGGSSAAAGGTTKTTTTLSSFFKLVGATRVGTLGYGISPLSAENAKGSAESARRGGLGVGYVNSNFPFGSTDVAPIALGMKKGGVDGFTAATDP